MRRPGCPSVCLSCPFLPSSSEDVCLSLRGVICTPCFLIFKNGFIGVTLYTPYSFPIKVYHSVDVKLFPDVCTRTAVGWRTFPRPPQTTPTPTLTQTTPRIETRPPPTTSICHSTTNPLSVCVDLPLADISSPQKHKIPFSFAGTRRNPRHPGKQNSEEHLALFYHFQQSSTYQLKKWNCRNTAYPLPWR